MGDKGHTESTFILTWTFTPADFFGRDITDPKDGYSLATTAGRVEARLPSSRFVDNGSTLKEIDELLKVRFRMRRMTTGRNFQLSEPGKCEILADGRQRHSLVVSSSLAGSIVDTPTLLQTDKDGNPIVERLQVTRLRQDRLRKEREVEDWRIAVAEGDPLARKLLGSYDSAVKNPDHEFFHLYEIRDALQKRFDTKKLAREAVGISEERWRRFDELTNDPEIKQGRHRGKNTGNFRAATRRELEECRKIARDMIMGYIHLVESG